MMKLLTENDICVCEMKEIFAISESQVSRSLKILQDAGFLERWQDGKCVVYMANRNNPNPSCQLMLDHIAGNFNNDEQVNAYRMKLRDVIARKMREKKR